MNPLDARNVLARGNRHFRGCPQPAPFLARPVGADGLLQPSQIERGQPRHHLQRLIDRPALIGIGSEHARADDRAQRGQIGEVGLGTEADLQLQRAMATRERGFGRLRGAARIDAAGIDLDPARLPTEKPPQRQALPARGEIPQREIDARNRLRERTGLAALKRQHFGTLRQDLESLGGAVEPAPDKARSQHFVDQAGHGARRPVQESWTRLRPIPRHRPRRLRERRWPVELSILPNDVTTGVAKG